ncbi:carbohydrate ABC transporter permease [Microbacterium sediminis]|uniref:Sugar ABC transporter permease n=1 Tax=Microbacterium sediminis TaxID=904291 RepID=A0A1B9NG87_9MICO|nr:carbohydrate ABC transporter permease [Microbacterium sediminis]OCG75583.1 sugar ABC transporter permease [Microbacterium sediminis]
MSASTRRRRGALGRGVLVALLLAFTLLPAWLMVATGFDAEANRGAALIPREFTLAHFQTIFERGQFGQFLLNSAFVALIVVLASAVLALLASVAVARFRFRGRSAVLMLVLIVQMVPLEALLIPLFLQIRDLQLLGTLLGLMVVYVALSLPFGIWMLRGFVAAVPVELEEAAYLDGASWGRMFRSVMLPLVMPGVVATSIFSFITAWNEFIFALVLLRTNTEQYTVAIGLRQFFTQNGNDWGAIMAASTIITIPVMVFFVIVQGRLSSGLVAGAVKG